MIGSATLPSDVTIEITTSPGTASVSSQAGAVGRIPRRSRAMPSSVDPTMVSSRNGAVTTKTASTMPWSTEDHWVQYSARTESVAPTYPVSAMRQAHFSKPTGCRRRRTTNAHSVKARNTGNQILPHVT
jgi:hypothetical protein